MTRASDIVGAASDGGALLDTSPTSPVESTRSLRDRVAALEDALNAAIIANSQLTNRVTSIELEVFGAVQE